jgi:hypothetical protein
MNILVACEESQRVCIAFRNKGHNAFSCDIDNCSGGHNEWHIKQDVIPLLNGNCEFTTCDGTLHKINGKWDMIIGFPPCTYITAAGACRLYPKKGIMDLERFAKGKEAAEFFMAILNADCEKIVVENPTPLKAYNLPKYNQVIEPFQFGHPYKKRTCLWLKGVNPLQPTEIITEGITSWVCAGSKDSKGNPRKAALTNSTFRDAKTRSKTFTGIASAMAAQWG